MIIFGEVEKYMLVKINDNNCIKFMKNEKYLLHTGSSIQVAASRVTRNWIVNEYTPNRPWVK